MSGRLRVPPGLSWGGTMMAVGGLLLLAEVVWFAVSLPAPVGPPMVGNLPVLALAALVLVGYWRASRAPGVTPAARRFWRTMLASGAISLSTLLLDLPDYLHGPVPKPDPIGTTLQVISVGLVLFMLYRLPLGVSSRAERLRLMLDVATVTLAAVLFAWYFTFAKVSATTTGGKQALNTTLMCTLIAIIALALVKVIMSGSRTIDPWVLRLLGLALCAEVIGMLSAPALGDRHHVATEPVGRSVLYLFLIAAAVRQWRLGTERSVPTTGVRRQFSVLPYVAVACVDGLLLYVLRARDNTTVVVGVAAVVLTFLVIVRQLAAFRDNSRLLDELARQERRFRSLVLNAADAIVICDPDGRVTYASPALERITGVPAEAWLSGAHFDVVHPDDLPVLREQFQRALEVAGTSGAIQARIAHARSAHFEGDWRWIELTFTNLLDDPAVAGLVLNISDVTEARRAHQQLSHQASHDSLTDLANRSLFGEQLQLALLREGGRDLWLALVDLDDFKSVNDTLGHQAGDALLIAVAERLRRAVRPQDLVARLGGDEFAIILEHVDDSNVANVMERMLAVLAEPVVIEGQRLSTRASIGIAGARPGEDATELVRHADIAMYEAKAAGKGRYARYTEAMDPLATH